MADDMDKNGAVAEQAPTADQHQPPAPSPTTKEGTKLLSQGESKYPKSVFFIIGTEFCERFSYYGMRAILILYLTTWLGLHASIATAVFHSFVVLCYFSPMFGAIIADGYLGKYHTILYVSLVYAAGNIVMTFTAFPPPYWVGPMFGLILIGLGTGGIKPCVSAFGGDQFASDQSKQRSQFFSVFYFTINLGSFLSMMITPMVRESVQCFGASCFPVAFGIPAALMLISLVLFVFGRRFYKIYPATGSVIREMTFCIGRAIKKKFKSSEKKEHWLYHAEDKFDRSFIEDVRRVLHVFWLFIPLPVFWALYDQQGSRWTLQSTQLDLRVFSRWYILPDQVQAINSVLILVFIPLFEVIIYPLLDKCKVPNRPIQRMVAGMFLAAVAFVIAGILQIAIDKSLSEVHIKTGESKIHVLNASPCRVAAQDPLYITNPLKYSQSSKLSAIPSGDYVVALSADCRHASQPIDLSLPVTLHSQKAYYILVTGSSPPNATLLEFPLQKPGSGGSLIGMVLVDHTDELFDVTAMLTESDTYSFTLSNLKVSPYTELFPGRYRLSLSGNSSLVIESVMKIPALVLKSGAVRTIVIEANNTKFESVSFTNVHANTVSVWLQFPQYIIITAAEVLFSITGLSFAYSQAPESMKSVVQAAWLLTTAFGDLIVVIVAGVQLFNQAVEFFFFAILMAVTTVVFGVMGYFYKYVDGTVDSDNVYHNLEDDGAADDDHKQPTTGESIGLETTEALVAEHH